MGVKISKTTLEDLIVTEATVGGCVLEPGLIANLVSEDYDWAALRERCRDRIIEFYKGAEERPVLSEGTLKFIDEILDIWCCREVYIVGKMDNEFDKHYMTGELDEAISQLGAIDYVAKKGLEQMPNGHDRVKNWIEYTCARLHLRCDASEVYQRLSSQKESKVKGMKM